ncbi:MAG: ATP-dependent DNA helicase RecG [Tissierellia bacterium]|nr:ATP-dependent DNA helicase RecG [Tissierellia bacterium]
MVKTYTKHSSITCLKGIGPAMQKKLEALNIQTISDLLYHVPTGYDNRKQVGYFNVIDDGKKKSYECYIDQKPKVRYLGRGKSMIELSVLQNGVKGKVVFFNQGYLANKLFAGRSYKFFGKLSFFMNRPQLTNPVILSNDLEESVVPIYGLTKGLTGKKLWKWMEEALDLYDGNNLLFSTDGSRITEKEALKMLHFPKDLSEALLARKKLAFDELVLFQLGLRYDNDPQVIQKGYRIWAAEPMKILEQKLPFELTEGQRLAINEIQDDFSKEASMNRLIQGDVGSGKTAIAAMSMYACAKSGGQSVLMAPTEILALQHHKFMCELFAFDPSIHVEILIGQLTAKQKTLVKEKIASGMTNIVIGTHALIQEDVIFANLALAITDEQHRFGVKQRKTLVNLNSRKDIVAHNLSLTATPIPRSLALILYGDMDVSEVKGMPPGRKPIETYVISNALLERMYGFIEDQIKKGRQAYMVCPMITDENELNIMSVEKLETELNKSVLKNYRIEILHGKQPSKQKEEIMANIANGSIDILISTTVIEVGVNVPNASVMVVFNAERFGLSQIHQLRGRVGRGEEQSYCILVNEGKTRESYERMNTLKRSSDGFEIAEKDLELRGPGEILGYRQHGVPAFRVADLALDHSMLRDARKLALQILDGDIAPAVEEKLEDYLRKLEEMSR